MASSTANTSFIASKLAELNKGPLPKLPPLPKVVNKYKDVVVNKENWLDNGVYWLYNEKQLSLGWHKVRQYRLSGSSTGTALGHSNFSTPDELSREMAGLKEKVFSERQIRVMAVGTLKEPFIRDAYCAKTGYTVIELGFCVPKFDLKIGVSVDGVVENEDGIIEIKAAQRMYKPLIEFTNSGRTTDDIYSHIWRTHYDQMQLGMKVMGKSWCDYVVMCVTDNQMFIQRVNFNETYWNDVIYPGIKDFLENKLYPLLPEDFQIEMPPLS